MPSTEKTGQIPLGYPLFRWNLIALLRSYGYTRFAELETFIRSGATTTVPDLTRPRNILAMTRLDSSPEREDHRQRSPSLGGAAEVT
jgi:hypothetical protein